jgi:chloride channel protein, CIC family
VPVLVCGIAVALARLIVRWYPEASGSGVQRVEARIRNELPLHTRTGIIPAKFVGGVLAIGGGLALGREGPTVQMGGVIGDRVGAASGLSEHDRLTLSTSLAGAGLAVAFSAPIGGALFVFEEVARAFRTRLVLATLAGVVAAMAASRLLVGSEPILPVPQPDSGPGWMLVLYAAFGIVMGALGVAYNRFVVLLLDAFDAIRRVPPEVKAGAVGALVGLVGILAPTVIGGGEELNETILVDSIPLATLLGILLIRWLLGPLSYSVGAPGGLFAPLLLVGAAAGAVFAQVLNTVVPDMQASSLTFAIIGMSTFFAAVVRAPFTGVVLIVEMTATTAVVLPMLLAAGAAVLVATLLRGPPIYDTLRDRMKVAR